MKTKLSPYYFLLCLINLITFSCQSKSEKINLNILDQRSQNIIGNKQVFPLRYHSFVDTLHTPCSINLIIKSICGILNFKKLAYNQSKE